ncbi:acetyltransferase, GNAT family protein [Tritrichomonas foetus]|uniref:Acetyltransferase, GNAT family protein n=1 Tax=Tritrichomonas foetus TaxID=1144522 RepID=A0A1J4JU49_9EUKA|nr:acetyltransferase, GNAT family protein [Tritrichomonas foetus]|eukprot:OHT01046.1 acetyltransferase, GNAT family protein [Tritrichomonas foetus]
MRPSLFPPPRPHLRRVLPKYPQWDPPKRSEPEEGAYRMSAQDFGISLQPALKTTSFAQYEDDLQYRLVTNDGTDQALIWLTMARNIFHRELAQMPENYISKLVFNRYHHTVVLIKDGLVYGGICFRPFFDRDFAEIAFCAVSSIQQIRGFGAHLMAQVKTYLQALGIHNILTYADNSAVGYFKRQGFTLQINFNPEIWTRCIKDYQGATLIHCKIHPKVDYLHINAIIDCQKRYTSMLLPDEEVYKFDSWPITSIRGIKIEKAPTLNITDQMRLIVEKTKQHSRSWPFRKPVSKSEAPNYNEIIKTRMDLSLLERNIEDGKYKSIDDFERDLRLIFSNCYTYNNPESVYTKSAKELEVYVNELLLKSRAVHRR